MLSTTHPPQPLRTLSPGRKKAFQHFYVPPSRVLVMAAGCLPLLPGLALSAIARHRPVLGLMVLGGGVVAAALLMLLLYWNGHRKAERAEFVYKYGQPETMKFIGITESHHNQPPQQVVHLVRHEGSVTFKTLNPALITAFSLPRQVVYMHPRYPDVLVPDGLFGLGRPN